MRKAMISILVICFTTAAFTQTKPRLAILPITGGTGGDGETIAELFSFDPDINRVFVPVPRTSSIEAVIREQQFQSSTGLTDADTIARLGVQVNADYVVAGHIQVLGNRNLVLITIIHVESLQQIAGDYRQYGNIEEIQGMIPDMARRIARAAQLDRTNLPRLAVLPFSVSTGGVNQNDAEVLAQILATEVANSGRYVVLPRTSLIQTVLMEQEIQRSGITEQDSIKAVGKALNAQYVLSGNVRSLGQNNMFTALILETERGEQVNGASENYNTVADGLTHIAALSGKLVNADAADTASASERPPIPGFDKMNTLGLSVGSAFAAPLLVITAHGSFSFLGNFFAEIGVDVGFFSAYAADTDYSYYSIYPFAHIGYFMPLGNNLIIFAGAGAGLMIFNYTFFLSSAFYSYDFVYEDLIPALDLTAGVLIGNIDISYTLRTNFESANNKLSVGYVYRFK